MRWSERHPPRVPISSGSDALRSTLTPGGRHSSSYRKAQKTQTSRLSNMIDMKEAWDSGHPDKIASLSHSRLKEMQNGAEWDFDRKQTPKPRGFKKRARALEPELQNRRHNTATVVSIVAAAIALVTAKASLYGALHGPPAENKKKTQLEHSS